MSTTAAELLIKIRAIVDGAQNVDQVRAGLAGLDDAAKQGAAGTDGLSASLKKLGGVLAGVFALGQVQQFASTLSGLSDEYTRLIGKLNLSTDSSEEQARVYTVLRDIADQVGVQTSELVTTFSRLKTATEGAGGSTSQLLDITESLAKALAVGGASTAEAASVLRQFGQAMASGVLRGDEFNSLMENAPPLMSAVADSLGTTTGALRALAEDGELSSTVIANAVLEQGARIDAQFAKLPTTLEQSAQRVSNAFLDFVGKADQASGASRALVEVITAVAGKFEALASGALALAGLAAAKLAQSLVTTVAASSAAATAATANAAAQATAARTAAANAAAQAAVARAVLAAEIANHKLAASLGVSSAATLANVQAARASAAAYATQAAALAPATASVSAAAVAAKLFNGSLLLLASAVGGFSLGNLLNEFESVRATAVGVIGAFDKLAAGAELAIAVLTRPFDAAKSYADYEKRLREIETTTRNATRAELDANKARQSGRESVEQFTEVAAKAIQRQIAQAEAATKSAKSRAAAEVAASEQVVAATNAEAAASTAAAAAAAAKAKGAAAIAAAATAEADAAASLVTALIAEEKQRGKATAITQAAISAARVEAEAKAAAAAAANTAAVAAAREAAERAKAVEPLRAQTDAIGRLIARVQAQQGATQTLAEIEAKTRAQSLRNSGLEVSALGVEAAALREVVTAREAAASVAAEAVANAANQLEILRQQAGAEAQRSAAQREGIEAAEAALATAKEAAAQTRLSVEVARGEAQAHHDTASAKRDHAAAAEALTAAQKAEAEAAGKSAFEVQRLAATTQDLAKAQALEGIAATKAAQENDSFMASARSAAAGIAKYIEQVGLMALANARNAGAADVSSAAFDRLYRSILGGKNLAQVAGNFHELFTNIKESAGEATAAAVEQQNAYTVLFNRVASGTLSLRELDLALNSVAASEVTVDDASKGIVYGLGLIDQSRLDNLTGQIEQAKRAMLDLVAATEDQIFAEEQRRRRLQGDDIAAKQAEFARQEAVLQKEIAATQDIELRRRLSERLDLMRENDRTELEQLRSKERERKRIEAEAEAERQQRAADKQDAPAPDTPPALRPDRPSPRPNIQEDADAEDKAREELHQRELRRIAARQAAGKLNVTLGFTSIDEVYPELERRIMRGIAERQRLRG